MNHKEMSYSQFSQYFIEMMDEFKGIESEVEELLSSGDDVPQPLASELFRHQVIVDILTQAGKELYNKTPKELYKDGWAFWFKEDAELREKRYGKK
jgi:hypothetical protein